MPQQMMNQGQMMQPPSAITVKDHLYIEDMLSWNLLTVKKANFFAQQCQDQEVKQAIQKMVTSHERHYQRLLNHLQKEMSAGAQTAQMSQSTQNNQPQMGGMH
ncbi:hypothetical protein PU629_05130 [Pullulanibacillus sp. KACC 23026]|uniref:hypothetical protein n=1 Tax=Pullulanibacillus sp. KACC 23026 TaxID=3028315 RepID=UPI0023AF3A0D|nr:hypothetical protein [Pullulanibacillus sp. KACC 23026]WEG13751.1 hypothetical protein PU629_05130 [Pullulanibacillus sp. KACC 23026]